MSPGLGGLPCLPPGWSLMEARCACLRGCSPGILEIFVGPGEGAWCRCPGSWLHLSTLRGAEMDAWLGA